jgi:hypothetical protein
LLFSVVLLAAIFLLFYIYVNNQSLHTAKLVMGAQLYSHFMDTTPPEGDTWQPDTEKYFRPSKLPILNNRIIGHDFLHEHQSKDPTSVKIPEDFYKSPEDTIINYFSFLRDAANLIKGKIAGCGTVGSWKLPFPIGYTFFTADYKKRISYEQYLKSFDGIGHTNLIKLKKLPPDLLYPKHDKYFIELETIEGSDKGISYFAYYYGYIYIQKQNDNYLISDMMLYGEDFLCAPYHGWYHDAEANVSIRYGNWCKMIEKQYPTKQIDYVKKIYFMGTDGYDYLIEFMHLTNDTDVEVSQYKKSSEGNWNVVYLKPEKCVEEKINKSGLGNI